MRHRPPMTHERLSGAVLMAALVVVAAAWLWFLLAFANLIFLLIAALPFGGEGVRDRWGMRSVLVGERVCHRFRTGQAQRPRFRRLAVSVSHKLNQTRA